VYRGSNPLRALKSKGGKQKMRMRRNGTFDEMMAEVWALYMKQKASNSSTRRFLENVKVFTKTQIFHLMEMLQVNRGKENIKEVEKHKVVKYSEAKHWCIACGNETYINPYGVCEGCWEKYAHLRVVEEE